MENASKALLMAGGILFAIIVLSILVLSYNSMTDMKQAEAEQELMEEVYEFNQPYLAFNKKAMYGTDVISVLNLAINNNRVNNVGRPGELYYVNVYFTLTKDSVQNTTYEYVLNTSTAIYTKNPSTDPAGYGVGNLVFEQNHTYNLYGNLEPITAFLLTAEQNEETKEILEQQGATIIRYKIRYSGIADFKRKTFKCSNVEYDEEGRVSAIHFQQIQASTYGEEGE